MSHSHWVLFGYGIAVAIQFLMVFLVVIVKRKKLAADPELACFFNGSYPSCFAMVLILWLGCFLCLPIIGFAASFFMDEKASGE